MSANGHQQIKDPSPWIERFSDAIPKGCRVLDLACGGGRHGRFFLRRDCRVTFLDRDVSGVSDMADTDQAEIVEADLETDLPWPLADRRFDAVIVTNYLWRPVLPDIMAAVETGDILLYETFALGNEAFGRPRNPDFLLRPGELLEAARGQLTVLRYEQCKLDHPSPRMVQRIAATRPD